MNIHTSPLILVHSPLVGGLFWQPVAREVERRGGQCYVPTIQKSNKESVSSWQSWPDHICDALPSTSSAILVGHSAAGLLLPALAQRVDAHGLIFVDANIPPESGTVRPVDAEFMKFVQSLPVVDGRLPRWSEWWPPSAMEMLFPDVQERRQFDGNLPRLTLEWFDDAVEVPPWQALHAGYVQTSDRFSHEAEKARERGWPVVVLKGTHLHPLLKPQETIDAILEVTRQFADHVIAEDQ